MVRQPHHTTPQLGQAVATQATHPKQTLMPYDENLLERSRTQWQFGDWQSLTKLNRDTLQHHPDRAKLALLAAAGHLQTGKSDSTEARQFIRLAQDWGIDRKLIGRVLIAGVHNHLGRAAAVAKQETRAWDHFEKAISIGAPSSATRLLIQARISEQLHQLGRSSLNSAIPHKNLQWLYSTHDGYVSDKWTLYLSEYEHLFNSLRNKPVRMLEIGVQNGGSLEIWSQYFTRAQQIIGCDINPACAQLNYTDERIRLVIGDINKQKTIETILSHCREFDIIIDDGSHTSSDIIRTFCRLFSRLRFDGLYIVEDLHCSYWKKFDGGLNYLHSSMAFFKALVDVLNFEHWGVEYDCKHFLQPFGITPELSEALLAELHSITFVNSMCIITRRSAEANQLGRRHVAGEQELVCSIKQLHGSYSKIPTKSLTLSGTIV